MRCIRLVLAILLVPALAWAEGVLTPIANPPITSLYDYRTTIELQEDFLTGATSNGTFGQLGWFVGGGTVSNLTAEANRIGIVRKATSASSGTVSYLLLSGSQTQVLYTQDRAETWAVRVNQIDANTTVRVGESNVCTVAPTDGVYFERADGETNWYAVTRASSSSSRSDTGIAATTGWITLKIVHRAAGTAIDFFINGVFIITKTTQIPALNRQPCMQIVNSTTADKTMDVDYFEMKITGLTR